jgi:hypothetical protein
MSYWFYDDNNVELLEVQQRLRPSLISQFFYYPALQYLKAAQYVGVETEISTRINKIIAGEILPQKYLNELYDFFAAAYRFDTILSYQMKLFEEDKSLTEQYELGWKDFLAQELAEITKDNCQARLLLKAIVFSDDEIGEESYDELWEQIAYRYPMNEKKKEVLPETVIEEMKRETALKNDSWSPSR